MSGASPDTIEVTSAEEVRRLLDAKRKELGATSADVARAAGYQDSSYWSWQKEQRRVTLEAALCYLRALGFRIHLIPDKPLVGQSKKRAAQ